MRRLIAAAVAAVTLATVPAHVDAHHSDRQEQDTVWVAYGSTGQRVAEIQYLLASYGFVLAVDGIFGPRTEAVVMRWQQMNGLKVDGIVGPVTWASLWKPWLQRQLTPWNAPRPSPPTTAPTSAPPAGGTLAGRGPLCDEMVAARQAVGLPERFDGIGWRESRCRNDVTSPSGCCVGWWQLHRVIFRDHRMIPKVQACGATWANIQGTDSASKRRQACVAKALYDTVGLDPWSLTL